MGTRHENINFNFFVSFCSFICLQAVYQLSDLCANLSFPIISHFVIDLLSI